MKKLAPVLASVLMLAGCGGSGTKPTRTVAPRAVGCNVPLGKGRMGACIPTTAKKLPSSKAGVSGPQVLGADVSDYNSCAGLSGLRFVTIKAGEGNSFVAHTLACHVADARRARIPWAVYYFQRPGDQAYEAQRFVNIVKQYGSPPLGWVIDSEVGVSTSQTCQFAYALWKLTRRIPVIYTSPGLWPGGGSCGSYLWVADYANGYVIPNGWSRVYEWQFTDGQYGPYPHGLGAVNGDIDQDRGLIAVELAQPADPYAVFPARAVRTRRGYFSERIVVKAYDHAHCTVTTKRPVCWRLRGEMYALEARVMFFVTHSGGFGINHRGLRYREMRRRSGG